MSALQRLIRPSLNSINKNFSTCLALSQKPASTKESGVAAAEDDFVDIIYGSEHQQLRDSLKKIIETEINPYVDEWEKNKIFPAHKVFKTLGDNGFLGVTKPKEYGGLGLDYSYSVAMAEALGDIRCGGLPMAIGVQTDMATPALAKFGSEYLKREFLAPSISGDRVACLGVSEVGSGSDVASIQTRGTRDGDDLIINGGKMWTTNGTQADWMCLLANTDSGKPHQNKSLICLPMDSPGITIARSLDKLGMHSSDTAQIYFENVRVPAKNVIGKEGQGFTYQMIQFQEERIFAAAMAIKPMELIIQETIDYTRERKIFGASVLDQQYVHYTLAELATEVEMLKSAIYRTVALYVRGQDVTKQASMCKLKCGRLLRESIDKCLQFWGGMGFMNEMLVSRLYRDMRLVSIGGGADEVMLAIICKYMNTLPKPPQALPKKS